jgi:hypothetical protein
LENVGTDEGKSFHVAGSASQVVDC